VAAANWKRFFVMPDTHGQFVHEGHLAACMAHCEDYKPHIRVHLGDFLDCTCMRANADGHDQGVSLSEDVTAAKRMLEAFRPHVVLFGNHESRISRWLDSPVTAKRELAQMCMDDITGFIGKLGGRWLPYHAKKGVYMLGDTAVVHGYGFSMHAEYVHAMTYGNCIMGHVHRIGQATGRRLGGPVCRSIGWLGDDEALTYMDGKMGVMRHEPGWYYGRVNERTGSVVGWQARYIDDEWHTA